MVKPSNKLLHYASSFVCVLTRYIMVLFSYSETFQNIKAQFLSKKASTFIPWEIGIILKKDRYGF